MRDPWTWGNFVTMDNSTSLPACVIGDPVTHLAAVPADITVLRCTHEGEPIAKQRPRMGRRGHIYTPGSTRDHQRAIALLARSQLAAGHTPDVDYTFGVRAVFYVQTYQRKDVDNMLKAVLDSLNKLVFADDCQVKELMGWSVVDAERPRTEFVVYRLSKIDRVGGVCVQCGNPFRRYKSWAARVYCSRACNTKAVTQAVDVPCAQCGKRLLRLPSIIEKNKGGEFFCSGACLGKKKRLHTACNVCGKAISRPKSFRKSGQTRFYCSMDCRAIGRIGSKRNISPEQLGLIAQKGWETRRRRGGQQ